MSRQPIPSELENITIDWLIPFCVILMTFGITQQGRPCKRCIAKGDFCYQHVHQRPRTTTITATTTTTRSMSQSFPELNDPDTTTSAASTTRRTFARTQQEGFPCKICIARQDVCHFHEHERRRTVLLPEEPRNARSILASSLSSLSHPPPPSDGGTPTSTTTTTIAFGITQKGLPCKICIRMQSFCYYHQDQRPTSPRRMEDLLQVSTFGITQRGLPCKICIRMQDFCHLHIDQRPAARPPRREEEAAAAAALEEIHVPATRVASTRNHSSPTSCEQVPPLGNGTPGTTTSQDDTLRQSMSVQELSNRSASRTQPRTSRQRRLSQRLESSGSSHNRGRPQESISVLVPPPPTRATSGGDAVTTSSSSNHSHSTASRHHPVDSEARNNANHTNNTCMICYDTLEAPPDADAPVTRLMFCCGQSFHRSCVLRWNRRGKCPICKITIPEERGGGRVVRGDATRSLSSRSRRHRRTQRNNQEELSDDMLAIIAGFSPV